MQWFEKCKCGQYRYSHHNCVYNNKDLKIKKLEQQKAELINLLCERCDCIGMCEIEEIPCAVHKFKER